MVLLIEVEHNILMFILCPFISSFILHFSYCFDGNIMDCCVCDVSCLCISGTLCLQVVGDTLLETQIREKTGTESQTVKPKETKERNWDKERKKWWQKSQKQKFSVKGEKEAICNKTIWRVLSFFSFSFFCRNREEAGKEGMWENIMSKCVNVNIRHCNNTSNGEKLLFRYYI